MASISSAGATRPPASSLWMICRIKTWSGFRVRRELHACRSLRPLVRSTFKTNRGLKRVWERCTALRGSSPFSLPLRVCRISTSAVLQRIGKGKRSSSQHLRQSGRLAFRSVAACLAMCRTEFHSSRTSARKDRALDRVIALLLHSGTLALLFTSRYLKSPACPQRSGACRFHSTSLAFLLNGQDSSGSISGHHRTLLAVMFRTIRCPLVAGRLTLALWLKTLQRAEVSRLVGVPTTHPICR